MFNTWWQTAFSIWMLSCNLSIVFLIQRNCSRFSHSSQNLAMCGKMSEQFSYSTKNQWSMINDQFKLKKIIYNTDLHHLWTNIEYQLYTAFQIDTRFFNEIVDIFDWRVFGIGHILLFNNLPNGIQFELIGVKFVRTDEIVLMAFVAN